MQHVCAGQLPNIGWRAVPDDHLRQHPLFVPLRAGAGKRTRGDVRLFDQGSEEWDSLHHGRLTTSRAAAFLGLCEPGSGKVLGMPGWRRGHERAISSLRHTGGLRKSEEQAGIVDALVFRDRAPAEEVFGALNEPLDLIRLAGLVPLTPEMVAKALARERLASGELWRRPEGYTHGVSPHLCTYTPSNDEDEGLYTTTGGASHLRMIWGSVHEATAVLVAMNTLLGRQIPRGEVVEMKAAPVPLLVPSSVVKSGAQKSATKQPRPPLLTIPPAAAAVPWTEVDAFLPPSPPISTTAAAPPVPVLTPSMLAALIAAKEGGGGGDGAPSSSSLPPCLSVNSRMFEVGCCTLEGVFEALAATDAPIPPEYAPAAPAFAHLRRRGGVPPPSLVVGGADGAASWRPVRYPFVGASPDGVIVYGDGRVEAVEVKNHSPFLDGKGGGGGGGGGGGEDDGGGDGFEEDGDCIMSSKGVPSSSSPRPPRATPHPSSPWLHVPPGGNSPHTLAPHYVPQVQLEIACLGPHCSGCNFVSLAGTGGARVYWVPRDNAYIASMLTLIGRVYATYSIGKGKGKGGKDPGVNYGAAFPEFTAFVNRTVEIARRAELRAEVPHGLVQRRPGPDPLFFDAPCDCHTPVAHPK